LKDRFPRARPAGEGTCERAGHGTPRRMATPPESPAASPSETRDGTGAVGRGGDRVRRPGGSTNPPALTVSEHRAGNSHPRASRSVFFARPGRSGRPARPVIRYTPLSASGAHIRPTRLGGVADTG